MGEIITPHNPFTGQVKRGHDSERVAKTREMLSATMASMKDSWMADMSTDPQGATLPDAKAIRVHYAEKWRATAFAVLKGTDPVEVDPEAMDRWIAEQLAGNELRKTMATPLHDIEDLEPFGYTRIAQPYQDAQAWCSTQTCLILRAGKRVDVLMFNLVDDVMIDGMTLWVSANDYTLGELSSLLKYARLRKPMLPNPTQLTLITNHLMHNEY